MTEIERLKEENKRLRKALQPFVNMYDLIKTSEPDAYWGVITLPCLEEAKQALEDH